MIPAPLPLPEPCSTRRRHRLLPLLLIFLAFGCQRRAPEVVAYTALDPVFARRVFAAFEERSGVRVRAVFDTEATKTAGLVERLRREARRPRCDVFWCNEPLRTIRLAREGVFAPYRSPAAAAIPAEFRDPDGLWTGFAARARVVAYDPRVVSAQAVPAALEELLAPRWRGRIALANPLFGTTGSHLALLLAAWGPERLRAFLTGLRDNGVQIVAGNSTARDRVLAGSAALGLTDTDDVEVARRRGERIDESFFPREGTVILPNTVALVANGPHPRAARALIDFILSEEVEALLAASPSRQIPLRTSVPVPPGGLFLSGMRRLPVSLEEGADALPEALAMAREILGL